ncbi:hypothetical protein FCN77_16285 [Arthrobacter sp. 24S4-2]|uniref:hypothetical protein n=1 Tax=Arthrobacter sp. 24S4-2 TaxID=2575374 RepID=UPI0010C7C8AC|nr:hypothetical protein [Arthrobacter sp. 24S4-2]QCO98973.1 hypothetical protein FCN77_16285 [Arthrobacter sp. 24S4-2]
MPTTTKWAVYFPAGSAVPNIPVQEQTQAESVEAAFNKVGAPPSVIFRKNMQAANGTSNAWSDIVWEIEDHKTSDMTHAASSASITVPTNGIYDIKAKLGVNVAALTTGVMIQVNGTDLTHTISSATSGAGAYDKVDTNHDLKLNAGDVVKIRGRVNSTGALFDTATCSMSIVRKVIL